MRTNGQRKTSPPPASSSSRWKPPSSFSIQATATCSPIAASATLPPKQQRCSRSAFSCSWNASVSGNRLRHQHVIDRHHSAAGADGQAALPAEHPLGLIPVAFVQSAGRGVHFQHPKREALDLALGYVGLGGFEKPAGHSPSLRA